VPLNLSGGQGADGRGTITPQMLRWIQPVTRDTSENALQQVPANLAGDVIVTDGYDVKLDWTGPDTDWGHFDVSWENTFVNDCTAVALGAVQPQQEGVEINDGAIPEWQSNLSLGWTDGDWPAGWTVRHIAPRSAVQASAAPPHGGSRTVCSQ
jgi:hypothetical protein